MKDKKALLIAALSSGSGKTTLTTGLLRHFKSTGKSPAPFKCGPDYIDTLHLSRAAGRSSHNLDSVMLGKEKVAEIFHIQSQNSEISITEGVMGFFDGVNHTDFKGSSLEIARITDVPVLLVLDCKGFSYSAAAMIAGVRALATDIRFAGVVLNNIASAKHESLITKAIKAHTDFNIAGVIPRESEKLLPSRHLGIKTALETDEEYFEACADIVKSNINTEEILKNADIKVPDIQPETTTPKTKKAFVAYDEAFQFYYDANFQYLESKGYEIVKFSPLNNETIDGADFVYLGGGYPEVFADQLCQCTNTMRSIKNFANSGGKIYAECGGLIYLCKSIENDGIIYPMAGVFDANAVMSDKRQALGYVNQEIKKTCAFGQEGNKTTGHEFHYSRIKNTNEDYVCELTGVTDGRKSPDGFVYKNTFGAYTHLHFYSENTPINNMLENDK